MADAKPAPSKRTAPWNSEKSDLQPDKTIVYGQLANGLRYAIKPNQRPQDKIYIRLVFDFGSAAESDSEQGLAHFLEHMAFNGSEHVPEGDMVKRLERLGLSFGADTNASTGYTKTTYKLDLPNRTPALLNEAMFLLSETAAKLTLSQSAIDREKGIILSEMRQRDTPGFQADKASNAFLYPGTYFAERYAIGTKPVIEAATSTQLRALYSQWYRPELAKLVVVGPVDPAKIELVITKYFSTWRSNAPLPADFDTCNLNTDRNGEGGIFTHSEIDEGVMIEKILPDKMRPDNFERALLQMKMAVADGIISDRIARRSRKEDIPLLGQNLTFQPGFCDKYALIGVGIAGKDGRWPTLIPFADQMLRQAVTHGFEQAEIDQQLKRFDASFENAARSETTRQSGGIASELAGLEDDIVSAPSQTLLLWLQIRPFLTRQSVSAEFSRWFGKLDRPLLFLTEKSGAKKDAENLTSSLEKSRSQPVVPFIRSDSGVFAYTNFGTASAIISDTNVADLGIRKIQFANGVKLNLKKTNYESNRIRYSLRIAGGDLFFADDANLATLFNGAYISGGLVAHDVDSLRALLAGSTVNAGISSNDDHFGSAGSITPKDLPLQMQVLAAYLQAPAWREDALKLYRRPLPEYFDRLDATAQSALNIGSARLMSENNPRFSLGTLDYLLKPDLAALKAKLGSTLQTAPIEIGLVGDLDEAAAIEAVAKSFAALPKRNEDVPDYAKELSVKWSDKRGIFEFNHGGKPDQLAWSARWLTTDDRDQKSELAMDLFARILTIRLIEELREKLGATYSPAVSSSMSDLYPKRGAFTISVGGDPKDLAVIESTVDSVVREMLAKPIDPDLFIRARQPVIESFVNWKRNNSTWAGIVSIAQTKADRLDRFRKHETIFRALTAIEVQNVARDFLNKPSDFTFRSLPRAINAKN